MGLRTVSFQVKPSTALEALFTLERAPSLSAAFRAALDSELTRVREPLALLAECVWWLSGAKVFRRSRAGARESAPWKPGRPVRSPRLVEGELSLDIPALAAKVEEGDEAATVTAVAVRTVADAIRDGAIVAAEDARAGRARVVAEALAREVRAHLERAERAAQRAAARVAKEAARAEAVARARREQTQRSRAQQGERDEQRASRARVGVGVGVGATASKRPRNARPASFGGLPEDAQPEDRTGPREQLSARGLTLDAEFFLDEAKLAWPCDARTVDQARKQLLARFHPDRAGEGATEAFQRAMRGYQALVRALERLSTTVRPVEHGAHIAAAHATRTSKPSASDGERSTRAPSDRATPASAVPPSSVAKEPRARGAERKASRSKTSHEPVGEWPPRSSRATAR